MSESVVIPVEGMDCAACARGIEGTLASVAGVQSAAVNYATAKASVTFDPAAVSLRKLMDTINELGANALYLDPIFSAYSNHRYDVTDYENVDPHLGGNNALANLSQALSERQMHYILDIVPNHCGFMHPWFLEAQRNPNAPSAEFFTWRLLAMMRSITAVVRMNHPCRA